MERLIYCFILSLLSYCTIGQSVSRSALTNGGKSAQTTTVKIDYSIGQAVIQTLQGTNNDLTQGIIQPTGKKPNSVKSILSSEEFTLFPNPNRGTFTVELIENNHVLDNFMVYNNLGQIVKMGSLKQSQEHFIPFDLRAFKSGLYQLLIYNKKSQLLINQPFIIQQ